MLNSCINDDGNDLTEEELAKFRKGLRDDVGDEDFDKFFDEMSRREMEAKGKTLVDNLGQYRY